MATTEPKLFTPIQFGPNTLQHRVVLAPMTRFRSDDNHVPITKLVAEHYAARAAVPGTLLITDAVYISARAGGFANAPGIWNQEQVDAWKQIVDEVHKRGSFIYIQLWALGRTATLEVLEKEGPYPYVAPSAKLYTGLPGVTPPATIPPRPLTIQEIQEYVQDYATAAWNAVHLAGFDGIEVHGANGYLPDQFLQDVINDRTDEYGGSIENRARFTLEVIDAIAQKIGPERTGLRLSPWNYLNDMGLEDPVPTFSYVVQQLAERQPNLGFIHVIEPRTDGLNDRTPAPGESNEFIRKIWQPRPIISTGGYDRETAIDYAEKKGYLIGFGRFYTSNPDLPLRLKKNLPLEKYDRSTFYTPKEPRGYNDFSFAPENEAELGRVPVLGDL
ncbi:FMN-linked oxidoreductase [Irpex lacteus]|nr:FMN-linked oxidoreductase [Irpex lacteus]